MAPVRLDPPAVRPRAIEVRQRVAQTRDRREPQAWRAPVGGILIVPADARQAGHIRPVGEIRRRRRRQLGVLAARPHREELIDAVRPRERGVHAGHGGGVLKAEERRLIRPVSLVGKQADQLVAIVDRLRHARRELIQARERRERRLKVVAGSDEIGLRIQTEQRRRLRRDARARDDATGKRHALRGS